MSPIESIDGNEAPSNLALMKQKSTAGELVSEIGQARSALTGMLLVNMERNGKNIEFYKEVKASKTKC